MKWPWIRRAEHERQAQSAVDMAVANERIAGWEREQAIRADLNARYDALLERYHTLKLQGAAVPEPKEPPAPKAQPDPVTQAIIARSGNSRFLRKHYNEFVREQRALNVDEADIAKAILDGESSAENEGVPA